MKTKISSIILSVFILSFAVFSFTSAQNNQANINSADNKANTQSNSTSTKNNNSSATVREKATSTTTERQNASTTDNTKGKFTSETHRSEVATLVQSLLSVADREGGIGTQVREVAKAQNNSASTTISAMTKIENRGGLRTFFFGNDYKNLGIIRSEIVTTDKNIIQLKSLLEQTNSDIDQAELNTQIQALETEQTRINAFITANEKKFSLFGWFNRLFVK